MILCDRGGNDLHDGKAQCNAKLGAGVEDSTRERLCVVWKHIGNDDKTNSEEDIVGNWRENLGDESIRPV